MQTSSNDSARKIALVTGANRGLGFATSAKLVARGYHVVIAARDLPSAEAAAAELRARTPGAVVDAMKLDLASFASARAFASAYRARGLPLHLLLANAGLIARDTLETSADGFEMQFATNHLGHFLLTLLLRDVLERSAPARVVVVSSTVHIPGVGPGKGPAFDYDNLDGKRGYDGMLFYRNSKLANMWFAYALSRRLSSAGVTVNALCPGFVPATAVEKARGLQWFLMRYAFPLLPMARTVDRASSHIAWVATAPELEKETGKFYADEKARPSSDDSYDVAQQERLWRVSEELVGTRWEAPSPSVVERP